MLMEAENQGQAILPHWKPCLVPELMSLLSTQEQDREACLFGYSGCGSKLQLIQKSCIGCLFLIQVTNCTILGGILAACHGYPSAQKQFLITPGLVSGRLYVINTQTNPRSPSLHKVVEPADIIQKIGLAYPHTSHCLASGDIMISCLGDKDGNAAGNRFLLLDSEFNVKGRWEKPGHSSLFGYDFWYQPWL